MLQLETLPAYLIKMGYFFHRKYDRLIQKHV